MPIFRGQVEDQRGDAVGGWPVVAELRITVPIPPPDADDLPTAPGDELGGGADDAAVTVPGSVPLMVTAQTDDQGKFSMSLPAAESVDGDVDFRVSNPAGKVAGTYTFAVNHDGIARLKVRRERPIPVSGLVDPATLPPKRLTGRVFDVNGCPVPVGLQVVVYGGATAQTLQPLLVTQTESGGYFRSDYPSGTFAVVAVRVASLAEMITVAPTADKGIPNPLLVAVTLDAKAMDEASKKCGGNCGGGCSGVGTGGCGTQVVPRTPDASDLVNAPDTYSTDLGTGGCVQFNVPNRSIDEFDYYSVVRTTEPEIRGVTLGAAAPASALVAPQAAITAGTAAPADAALARLGSFGPVGPLSPIIIGSVLWPGRPPGRGRLSALNPVDWDSTPTFFEAATIAHGHLLHMKQVWYADGYSLGDLLYSLPLAPGQKRVVAVLDWERRDQAGRTEGTLFSEGLQAAVSRDRDLNEVVSGTLSESLRGGSTSTTAGVGVGTGAAGNGTYNGFNFGALLGISGGYGESNASAWQESARTMGGRSMQSLRDTTLQSASALRGLRSTVVHSASQGEAVRASTEVVANHNRCHALTVQYFEVLRHLRVELELADVQECLFVPLPMTPFDGLKTLRWRESLATYLRMPALVGGFDAVSRVQSNWANSGEPAGRFAEETVSVVFGELDLTVQVPLPPIPEAPPPDPAKAAVDAVTSIGQALSPTRGFLGALLAVATGGASLLAGAVTDAVSAGANATAEALARTPGPEAKYAKFHREVMPGLVAGFVDQLELWAVVNGAERRINGADFTLVSDYRPGASLLVTVRAALSGGIARSAISRLMVRSRNGLPDGCRAIVNRAVLRYRTTSFEHVLTENYGADDIDLPKIVVGMNGFLPTITLVSQGAGATLFTPIDAWEQRNPRNEDRRLAQELVQHLNDNLEFYHQAIWWRMDANRRYMLLDGFIAPNSGGRSVASVTENRLIGIVGNSLVLPVARGVQLDPRFQPKEGEELIDLVDSYRPTTPIAPSRISLPTRGVFAEAVMGNCNACEKIDETRFWRWEDAPLDDVPSIEPLSTASRRAEPFDVGPTTFPTPVVSIQNAPAAPDPAGVAAVANLLGQASTFPDITGLAATQGASLAAYNKALDTAQAFGKEASTLAQQAAMTRSIDKSMDAIDKAEASGGISSQEAQSLRVSALRKMVGGDDGLTGDKVKERLDIVDEAAKKGSIGKGDAEDLNRRTLDRFVRIDEPGKPEEEAAAKQIDKITPGTVDEIEIGPQKTVVKTKRLRRRVSFVLTARYATDAIFPAQFDLGFLHEPTGKIESIAFDTTSEGVAQAFLDNPQPGPYSIVGRVLRTEELAPVASGSVAIIGASGPFTIDVPFSIDTTDLGVFFRPTGDFLLRPGTASVALLAVPTTASRTVKTSIALELGLNGEAAYTKDLVLKLGADLKKLIRADLEGKSGISLKAGGNLSAGQTTEFEITYQRITGIPIKPRP